MIKTSLQSWVQVDTASVPCTPGSNEFSPIEIKFVYARALILSSKEFLLMYERRELFWGNTKQWKHYASCCLWEMPVICHLNLIKQEGEMGKYSKAWGVMVLSYNSSPQGRWVVIYDPISMAKKCLLYPLTLWSDFHFEKCLWHCGHRFCAVKLPAWKDTSTFAIRQYF